MPDFPESATLLAFDFGLQRIGVAVGEVLLGQARALTAIVAPDNDTRFERIGKLIAEWQPQRLVVGLPLAPDGSERDMTARCRRFAHQLEGRFGLSVELIDERFSSSEAESRLAERGLSWQVAKREVDALAAQIILQDYLDAQLHCRAA